MYRPTSGLALICLAAIGACGGSDTSMDAARQIAPDGTIASLDAGSRDLARRAAETLAAEINEPLDAISVDSVRAVEWRDSSLGCPQPGEAYTQVITPGHRITLRADGKLWFVHQAGERSFVCIRQKAVGGVTPTLELEWGPMAADARRDLAGHLGVEEKAVIIDGAEQTTFTDESLGCPQPGRTYAFRQVDGYVLTLRYGSRNYRYHTDLDRVVACPPISVD